jgi:hypothetical protein
MLRIVTSPLILMAVSSASRAQETKRFSGDELRIPIGGPSAVALDMCNKCRIAGPAAAQ